jgi:hypothetical protein
MQALQTFVDSQASDADRAVANSLVATSRFLGSSWNQSVRRFAAQLGTLHTTVELDAGTHTWSYHLTFVGSEQVAAFIAASSRAVISDVSVRAFFGRACANSDATILSQFGRYEDADPAQDSDYKQPSLQIDMTTSLASGGAPPPWSRDMLVGQYGIGEQIKPKPLVGSAPQVDLRIHVNHAAKIPASTSCGLVMAYFIVTRE